METLELSQRQLARMLALPEDYRVVGVGQAHLWCASVRDRSRASNKTAA
jgi:hypothetical protein